MCMKMKTNTTCMLLHDQLHDRLCVIVFATGEVQVISAEDAFFSGAGDEQRCVAGGGAADFTAASRNSCGTSHVTSPSAPLLGSRAKKHALPPGP